MKVLLFFGIVTNCLFTLCNAGVGPRSNDIPQMENPGDLLISKYVSEISNLYKIYSVSNDNAKLKSTILKIFGDIKLKELTGPAFYHNHRIDFYINSLLNGAPVKAEDVDKYMDCPLTELILQHKTIVGQLPYISAKNYKKYKPYLIEQMFAKDPATFLYRTRDIFDEPHETRAAIMHLFMDGVHPTDYFGSLVDNENLLDYYQMCKYAFKSYVEAAQFLYVGGIVQSELDCKLGIIIAIEYIPKLNIDEVVTFVGILKNSNFLFKFLQKLPERGINVSEMVPFLMPRDDVMTMYNALANIEDVRESIRTRSKKYTEYTKIECGLTIGLEDNLLMPIIEFTDDFVATKSLLWIAIYKNRSIEIIQALISKIPTGFIFELEAMKGPVGKLLNGCFNASPEKILGLMKIGIGHSLGWFQRLDMPSRTGFLHYLLDNPDVDRPGLESIMLRCRLEGYQEADQHIMSKTIRYTMTFKGKSLFIADELVDEMTDLVRAEVKAALSEGVDPSPMFQREHNDPLDLDRFGMLVMEETSKNGTGFTNFVGSSFNDQDGFHGKNKDTICMLIKAGIQQNIGFAIGNLEHSVRFKDLIGCSLISLFSGLPNFPVNYSAIEVPVRPRLFKSIQNKPEGHWAYYSDIIKAFFHHMSPEEIEKARPWMSPFHRAVHDVLKSDGLIEMLNL